MFQQEITKEEINQLPLRKYEGNIVVATDDEHQAELLEEVSQYDAVGFDTEARPSFKRGVRYDVSLIQLAIPDNVFLIRLNHTGFTPELSDFFANDRVRKVGISIKDDLRNLARLGEQHRIRFTPRHILDLNDTAKQLNIPHMGVKKLTAIFLQFRVSKAQQTSNWENLKLTEQQLRYAATDAWVCLKIHQRLVDLGYL